MYTLLWSAGICLLASAPERSRFGVSTIRPVLLEAGFDVVVSSLATEALCEPPALTGGTGVDPVAACGYGDEMLLFTVRAPLRPGTT